MSIKDLLKNLKQSEPRNLNDHVLLIDSMNTFIRNFTMVKAMTLEGHHVGGMYGFLRSLGSLVRTFEPTRVICIFDGKGSTVNRKAINPEYKAQRQHTRITNWEAFDSREEELESLSGQIDRLKDYLSCLPVQVIELEKLEADDIIAFIAQQYATRGKQVTIVSSDKDFLQIIQPGIEVYSPVKKETITVSNVVEKLGVHPTNYLLVKAITGDQSDNLTGVRGAGIKTLVKEYPELITKPSLTLDEIYQVAETRLDGKKFYAKLIHNWDLVEKNYQIMNLQEHNLSETEVDKILQILSAPINKLQVGAFLHFLDVDQIQGPATNTESWLELFRSLTFYSK
jgi:5'-3' exonuclease